MTGVLRERGNLGPETHRERSQCEETGRLPVNMKTAHLQAKERGWEQISEAVGPADALMSDL